MSQDQPPTIYDVVVKLHGIQTALDRVVETQHAANLIAYAALPTIGKTERLRTQRTARELLHLPTGDPRD